MKKIFIGLIFSVLAFSVATLANAKGGDEFHPQPNHRYHHIKKHHVKKQVSHINVRRPAGHNQ